MTEKDKFSDKVKFKIRAFCNWHKIVSKTRDAAHTQECKSEADYKRFFSTCGKRPDFRCRWHILDEYPHDCPDVKRIEAYRGHVETRERNYMADEDDDKASFFYSEED